MSDYFVDIVFELICANLHVVVLIFNLVNVDVLFKYTSLLLRSDFSDDIILAEIIPIDRLLSVEASIIFILEVLLWLLHIVLG